MNNGEWGTMSIKENFATVINCMDGRVQLPVNEFMAKMYTVKYIDTITEAGPNKILAEESNKVLIESIKERMSVSVEKHGSKICAIVGHHDCGGNPSGKEQQILEIKKSIDLIKKWYDSIEVIGLWVNEQWQVEMI